MNRNKKGINIRHHRRRHQEEQDQASHRDQDQEQEKGAGKGSNPDLYAQPLRFCECQDKPGYARVTTRRSDFPNGSG